MSGPVVPPLPQLTLYARSPLPTARGTFEVLVFRTADQTEHLAMTLGDVAGEDVLGRVHSECLTSEVLGSLKCDCKEQLDLALDAIARAGRGVLLYLRQEGRGIGLGNKIRAYALQAQGLDTFEANRRLGLPEDARRYDIAAAMLKMLGVQSIALMTNNPAKLDGLARHGVQVRRVPSPATLQAHNRGYLQSKKDHTGHLIEGLDAPSPAVGEQDGSHKAG